MAKPSSPFCGVPDAMSLYHDGFPMAAPMAAPMMAPMTAPMTSHAPMPDVTKPPRRPLSSSANVLHPPFNTANGSYSPHKAHAPSPRSPLHHTVGSKLNMVSMAPPVANGPTTDSLHKRPHLTKFKTFAGKENVHPNVFPHQHHLSIENYNHKPNKRGLMDAAPIKDSRPAKKSKTDDDPPLPPHDSFPPILDDGHKPPHSYANLIGMAILRSPNRRLTLAQIYKWISEHYSFYNPNDAGWQNSIRHNLSLHKNFIKIERPKDDPGKGNYWAIEPGTEFQFLKEKATRKSAPSAENIPVMSTRLEPSKPAVTPSLEPKLPIAASRSTMPTSVSLPATPMLPQQLPPPQQLQPPPPQPQQQQQPSSGLPPLPVTQQPPVDVSSDATIPVSDNAASDEAADKAPDNELPAESSLYSPLPPNMHSSPPVAARNVERRSGTPPSDVRNPASSVTRSHKRRFASMDDSGYISSLDSSVMRPNNAKAALLLTSEADRPRIKRGRAEEEIARLRGSSPFSPTKSRSLFGLGPVSSSPLRQTSDNQMLPPLTPLVKMNPPVRPPPSVSPNTNLRLHRDKVRNMLQSPLRRVAGVGDDCIPWSPAFNLDDALYAFDDASGSTEFDIFQDMPAMGEGAYPGMSPLDTGSPVKRHIKRSRAAATDSAKKKSLTSAPLLKVHEQSPSQFLETPSKAFEGLGSPSRLFGGSPLRNMTPSRFSTSLDLPADCDWPGFGIDSQDFMGHDDAGIAEFPGLDILQGFEKIGSGAAANKESKAGKGPMGRTYQAW
ncbi:hypothetical protein CDD80_332 [Ophiocordyceps camponoti-rufipedis]|uniref:Fork-head domain-containing protein n=1 Tax=Ophiocordyceps camponoti-rufipedis TaxID=2004952 RepID=A0A2C5ZD05_9HYPO|nr:hypothetical protein CDD80_332 [Ophiocordyceps camponoti-rufipedis]